MAVSQMEKLSVVGPMGKEELVLQVMQGMGVVELTNVTDSLDESLVSPFLQEKENTTVMDRYALLKRVQDSADFIKRNTSDKDQVLLKRKEMTLDELEATYDEKRLLKNLTELETLQSNLANNDKTQKELSKEESEFARWQYLDINPKEQNTKEVFVTIGVLNNSNQVDLESGLKEIPQTYFEEVYHSPHHIYYFLLTMRENKGELDSLLNKVGFRTVEYSYDEDPKTHFEKIKNQINTLKEEQKALKKEIVKYTSLLKQLALDEEVILASVKREKSETLMGKAASAFVLEGWLPQEEKDGFLKALYEKVSKEDLVVEFTEPKKGEKVPTHLHNHPLVEPFEMLTEMYSLPKYGEIDPTPWMMPFYMVFFGMMMADIGYGLVMLLGTLVAKKVVVLTKSMTRFVNFFFILSFPTIIWGLIYGSIFGMSLPKPFPLLSTTTDVNTILLLSVVFGFIQIIFGLVINSVVLMKQKEYLNAIQDGFAWQGILIGIVLVLLGKMVFHMDAFFILGVVIAVLCALSIIVIPMFQSSSKVKGLAKGAYNLYGITSYIGDLVSYTRLMALGISGGSIASAFNLLVGYMPPVMRFTLGVLLIIALQALNMFLSMLSAYVHGARLQYVEFFGKFFQGGGRAFDPLNTDEKYVNIKHKTK